MSVINRHRVADPRKDWFGRRRFARRGQGRGSGRYGDKFGDQYIFSSVVLVHIKQPFVVNANGREPLVLQQWERLVSPIRYD